MTADAGPELPLLPPVAPRRWRVTMADQSTRLIEAPAFRVEHGAMVLVLPAGLAAAYAPGEWRKVEADPLKNNQPKSEAGT